MVGIQRVFGPRTKIVRSEPVQIINQNGHTNGSAQNYVSSHNSRQSPQVPSVSLYARLKKNTWEVYDIIRIQTNRCIRKCAISHTQIINTLSILMVIFFQRNSLLCYSQRLHGADRVWRKARNCPARTCPQRKVVKTLFITISASFLAWCPMMLPI